jgi:hypothetical protein
MVICLCVVCRLCRLGRLIGRIRGILLVLIVIVCIVRIVGILLVVCLMCRVLLWVAPILLRMWIQLGWACAIFLIGRMLESILIIVSITLGILLRSPVCLMSAMLNEGYH